MSSKISHNIKKRTEPKDIFITPKPLALTHINMISTDYNDKIWFDPFRNSGNYYNQFPTDKKEWTEILDGKDFFDFNKNIDVICSNPPYSMIDKILEKSVSLNPDVISFLLNINNLTAKRLEYMEKNNYSITKLHMCKVFKWYGMSLIVVFEKNKNPILSYDRIVWR